MRREGGSGRVLRWVFRPIGARSAPSKSFALVVLALAALGPTVASSQVLKPAVVSAGGGLSATEQALASAINDARAANGLPALQIDTDLESAARDHVQNMIVTDGFTHDLVKNGVDYPFSQWIGWYDSSGCDGENIAWYSPSLTPDKAVQMWLASPGHRANMLSASFTKLGVALVTAGGRSVAASDFGC